MKLNLSVYCPFGNEMLNVPFSSVDVPLTGTVFPLMYDETLTKSKLCNVRESYTLPVIVYCACVITDVSKRSRVSIFFMLGSIVSACFYFAEMSAIIPNL